MADELDFDGLDPNRLEKFDRVLPGSYHMAIVQAEEYGGKNNDKLVLEYQVISGTTPGMEGRTIKDNIPMSSDEWVRRKKAKIAFAIRLTTPEQAAAAKKAGKPISLNWSDAIGRHLCVRVKERRYDKDGTEQVTSQVGFSEDIFAIDAPDAQGIPIDRAAIKAAYGGKNPFGTPAPAQQQKPAAANGNGSHQPTKEKAAPLAGSTDDLWN